MIRPDPSQADSAAMLNQALAVSAKILAVPPARLAVFWLLSHNSQLARICLNFHHKSAPKNRHNSQRKIFAENSQEQPASWRTFAPGFSLSTRSFDSREGAKTRREYSDRPLASRYGLWRDAPHHRAIFAPSRLRAFA